MSEEVTHKEIYVRLCEVEEKVDLLQKNTADVVNAFHAAQGAFTVLDWLARAAKPILWVVGTIVAVTAMWQGNK
jgi:predicted CoA-binding protein